jgi:superfamily II DNA or RNA helicase
MSFLSQLRQRADAGRDGAVLCYLLRPEQEPPVARLALRLADVRGDRMENAGAPYVIQRAHLRTPPPFLNADDLGVLAGLLETDETWLSRSTGQPLGGWAFLNVLLATGRCFLDLPGQAPARLHAATALAAQPQWTVDTDGRQRLRWAVDGQVFGLAGSRDLVVYRAADRGLAPLEHELDDAAIEAAKPWFRAQAQEAVDALLADPDRWTGLGLPLPRKLEVQRLKPEPVAVLHCDLPAGATQARLRLLFQYSDERCCVCIAADDEAAEFRYWNGTQLIAFVRDGAAEAGYAAELAPALRGFTAGPDGSRADSPALWGRLLTEARPQLQQRGFQWRFTPAFLRYYAWPEQWQVSTATEDETSWRLQMRVSVQGRSIDLLELLAQLQESDLAQGGIRLDDGRLLLLPMSRAQSLAAELGDLSGQGGHGGGCLPNSQLNRLAMLAQQLPESTQWLDNAGLLDRARSLLQPAPTLTQGDIGLQATLRDYQWQGVCWLQHLRALGMNGLLADDMGLGKTLQTIAHLSLERSQGRLASPALIVAPTSLLHNWRQEAARFAPGLRVCIVHGPARHRLWDALARHDVLITSYTLLVNDLERWQRQPLSWLVLDEAQWIKNPATRSSQAVRQMLAEHRLCLTGTPVENHLGELWSIMDFLNPQCLGSERGFRHYFRQPIEQQGDASRMQLLLQRIAPWMLRRTKDQVASELPPKTVVQLKVPFTDEQRDFYRQLRSAAWADLDARLAEVEREGAQRVLVLSALLRLRQACCDPALLQRPDIASGKRQHCLDMIEELVAEGRAVLLFSQFTAMLDLLAEDLSRLGIAHFQLTGQTPADERKRRVAAFQAGEAPVFLISLKAGGVGLNLTRADVVIHYDPWWNSAAERQASDRAHRIGQDKPVFVYQLITEDSVEERIAELQQRKALLGEHVNRRAQASGERFALKLDELIALCRPGDDEGAADE